MIAYAVVVVLLWLVALVYLALAFRQTSRALDAPCAEYCQYARDVAMEPYSCAHGCVYERWRA